MSSQALLKTLEDPERHASDAPACGRLLLEADGTIAGCDPDGARLFGTTDGELRGAHVSTLIPRLVAEPGNLAWLSPKTMFLSHCDIPFRAIKRSGEPFMSTLYFNPLADSPTGRIILIVRKVNAWPHHARTYGPRIESDWCLE